MQNAIWARDELDALSPEQEMLLELLLAESSPEEDGAAQDAWTQTIEPCARTDGGRQLLAASWAQQRLWFFDQLQGGSVAYNIPMALRVRGSLDQNALVRALDLLVQRHEVLRTVFVNVDGELKQQIEPEGHFELQVVKVSGDGGARREAQIEFHKREEAQAPFDLSAGPLIRGRLVRVHEEDHVLLIAMHHIISDGWSSGVLIAELTQLYRAIHEGRDSPLEPLSIQYADYAQWQRLWLQGQTLQRQLSYWHSQLHGAPSQLELPTDRPRPAVQSYRGESVAFALDAQVARELNRVAERHGMTLFMVLHAAWALLLSRLSGQQDVVVGTPIANRRRPEVEGLIGFFVNMLALRVDATGSMSLREFLQQVKDVTVAAYDHQDVPFEQLVEALKPERSLSRHPVFQVAVVLQNTPRAELLLSDVSITSEEYANDAAKFDLLLELAEGAQGIVGRAVYAADLFDRQTIERWLACFAELLNGMIRGEQGRIDDLPILPENERRQVIELFNSSHAPYPHDQLIHELFEVHVRRTPEADAAAFGGESLTYAELNRRANQLAHFLRARGVGPDRLVGLCLDRSLELPVALLGVLKAGGAYLPLDPNYPSERLAYMLEDAAPVVLLTQEHLRCSLPDTNCLIVALDGDSDSNEIARHNSNNIDVRKLGLNPDSVANVIYTSGSSGLPKGVMVPHRGICNLAMTQLPVLGLGPDSRMLQFASLSFDACTWEWSGALCAGACLCLASREDLAPGEPLRATLQSLQITHAILAPVVAGAVSSTEGLEGLRSVVVGGEACSASLVQRWAPGRQFINGYGPTEATVCASLYVCDEREQGNPTIGRPIANARIYILDARGGPVPIGVAGEIHIGGAGVARGYLNRLELTAQRFVSDPFAGDVRARMYRTGDLGKWRPDGTIQYLGRNDDQVKIRGFRIELGEIEAQLRSHLQVHEVAVIAREDAPGDKRLVAYVVPSEAGSPPGVEDLRDHLKAVLPEYMVPKGFVMLEYLPLTPNGKLDRRTLPAPDLAAYVTRTYESPDGNMEQIVAAVWQSLLQVDRVGRHDNFFELGGHSLLIVQMLERLRRLGLTAEVRSVFESPTLADLALSLEVRVAAQVEVPPNLIPEACTAVTPEMLTLVELEAQQIELIVRSVPGGAANIQDVYPLAPLQEGILFHHLLSEGAGDTYVLPLVFEVSSRERIDDLIAALQAAIDRHDVLRTAVLWEQLPRPVQLVYRRATLPVTELELDPSRDLEEQIQEWVKPENQQLNIRRAPLMQLQVAADPRRSGRWYAFMQLHHMTIDHVALQVITGDVIAHLERRTRNRPTPVPYRNHVAQSLAYAQKHDAKEFFRSKLADVDEPTAPFGLLDVHGNGSQVEEAREELDARLSKRVRIQARQEGVSAATLFHAAWALVVAHTSGRDDVVFGSVLLGRLQGSAGAQQTLGMFINTLPLRLQLQALTAKELVEHTQRELVELLGHEQASLADAQRCSGIVGSAPLFSALLNYRHSVPDPQAEWSSATGIRALACQERTNYPITLSVDDLGEGFGLAALVHRQVGPQRLIGYLRSAIEALVDSLQQAPQTPALALSILPIAERHQVIDVLNATRVSYPGETLIHELFEAQVRRTPEADAVTHNGQSLSYFELNARANQLARHLRAAGVVPEQVVGICVERGLQMVVGLLAILKAGAAYLPLDPNYPTERLQHMLDDAAPAVLLTEEHLRSVVPLSSAKIITQDAEKPQIAAQSAENMTAAEVRQNSNHPVYLIYTSGSTGKPKGTLMPHRAMVNLIEWHRNDSRLGRAQRVLQFAALSFDVAFQETFSTLCTGGTLVLLDEAVRRDARALLELLSDQSIERLFVPPLMLQSLAECYQANDASTLQLTDIITAGEQLRVSGDIVRLFGRLQEGRLHNHYGPTETHVVTALTLTGEPAAWPTLPTIGRPIANTQIYVLDRRRQPSPLGVAGEIYIAGANVAHGYLNRPDLSAQRFLQDPFSAEPTARMYKTGDLGRWRADRSIEYLGRNDDQVKIRGYRIELGEIEAQLVRDGLVKEAAVIAREDVPGEKRLVAYVIRHGDSDTSTEELRLRLKGTLPDHMMPAAFVTLASLPLTPSGKLDRRALPAPEIGAYVSGSYEAPHGDVEERIATVWKQVLGLERIGRTDDFFELGGHSLLALKVLLRVNQAVGATLRVTDIYGSPTIMELAARIGGHTLEDDFVELTREAVLDPTIIAQPNPPRASDKVILLTGGTGFVGRFLLAQLLRETDATIYCHVRAKSQLQAVSRLKETLLRWDLWREASERIIAVAGDLRLPRLGMDEATCNTLIRDVDSIYHCATSMNHLETYVMAKAANVDSATEVLKLATLERPKVVNYISSLGVFGAAAGDPLRTVDESHPIEHEKYRQSQGYLASKWVSEKIFMMAAERGIPCNIFRLGLVWADSQQGRFDELQNIYRIMKSCLLSGYGIENYRFPMPPTPVDYVARAVVFLANRHRSGGGVFHIGSADQNVDDVFERCNEIVGASLDLLPGYDWIRELKRLHEQGVSLPAVPIMEYAFSMNEQSFQQHQRAVRSAVNVRFDFSRTHRELEEAGIHAPILNDSLLTTCLEGMFSRDPDLRKLAESGRAGGLRNRWGRERAS